MRTKGKKLIVMVPCFNEEKTLPAVINSIPKKIPGIAKIETLVIDDGSTDKTFQVAKQLKVNHIVRHNRNKGLGSTFVTGRDSALRLGAEAMVTIDGDNQFDATEIPLLIAPIIQGKADMVTGSRFLAKSKVKNMPALKYYGNKLFTKIVDLIVSRKYTDTQCGFRAYSRETALRLVLHGDFTYTHEIFLRLIDLDMTIVEVPIKVNYFKTRKSKISGSLWGYGRNSLGIIARATRDIQPLKFFGIPAAISLFSGIALGSFMFIRYIILHQTSPYKTFLDIAIALIIIGILIMFLALIADMLKEFRHNQEKIIYLLRKENYKKK